MEMESYAEIIKKRQKYKNQSNLKSKSKSKSKPKKKNNKKNINQNNSSKKLNISYDYIQNDSFEIKKDSKKDVKYNLTISKTNSIKYIYESNNDNIFAEFTNKKDINNKNYNYKKKQINEEELENDITLEKRFHKNKQIKNVIKKDLLANNQKEDNNINKIIQNKLIKRKLGTGKLHTPKKQRNINIKKSNTTYKPNYMVKLSIEDIADYDSNEIISNERNNYDFDSEQIRNKKIININKLNGLNGLNEDIIYYSKAEILHNTNLIFLNNSIYVKRKDLYMMTSEKFRKIVYKVLNAINIDIDQNEIDILFKKISQKSNYIIHSQFNDLLLELVEIIYPDNFIKNKKYTTNYFLNILFNCFKELLIEENTGLNDIYNNKYNSLLSLVSYSPKDNQILIINNILLTINEIYEKYFVYEFSTNPKFIKKSSKNLLEFCHDFEILSYIMNETEIITYYKLVINYEQPYIFFENETNKGILYTLNHFVLFLIHGSLYSYSKIYENKNIHIGDDECSDESKLLLFLEKLHFSKGMKNLRRKMLRVPSFKLSLIPSEDVYYQLGEINPRTGKLNKNNIIKNLLYNQTYY